MAKEPEVVFDIGWKFEPGAIMEPAMEPWNFNTDPGYDVWTSDMLAQVMDADYARLTREEINEVLDSRKVCGQ